MKQVRIVTRRSDLAMMQANIVAQQINNLGVKTVIIPISTKGDEILDQSLSKIGGKGLFTSALQEYLLNDLADIAVHSAKDLPHTLDQNLTIAACLPRDDVRDVLVSNKFLDVETAPKFSKIGTSSLRRAAQILNLRNDLEIVPIRGNVLTRLDKLSQNICDGLILAAAGLNRLNLTNKIAGYFDPQIFLPAIGQGILAIEARVLDTEILDILHRINHMQTMFELKAERNLAYLLNASCHSSVAGYAQVKSNTIEIRCSVSSTDGQIIVTEYICGDLHSYNSLTDQLVKKLFNKGAEKLLH